MAWCFSTRASVATVLTTHPCVSRCLRVKRISTLISTDIHFILCFLIVSFTHETEAYMNSSMPQHLYVQDYDVRDEFLIDILYWNCPQSSNSQITHHISSGHHSLILFKGFSWLTYIVAPPYIDTTGWQSFPPAKWRQPLTTKHYKLW